MVKLIYNYNYKILKKIYNNKFLNKLAQFRTFIFSNLNLNKSILSINLKFFFFFLMGNSLLGWHLAQFHLIFLYNLYIIYKRILIFGLEYFYVIQKYP